MFGGKTIKPTIDFPTMTRIKNSINDDDGGLV